MVARQILQYFRHAGEMDTLGHAYLIEASSPTLLRDTAGQAARLLGCERHTGCGQCYFCRAFDSGSHPDIRWLVQAKPGTISVGEIRDQVVNDMMIRHYHGNKKIYLIPHAERMTPEAQNALLKTLEEPPEYGILFLLTENAEKLLPTIRSRCFFLRLHGDEAAESPSAGGEIFLSLLRRSGHMEAAEEKELIERLIREESGDRDPDQPPLMREIVSLAGRWFRDILAYRTTGDEDAILMKSEKEPIRSLAKYYSLRQLDSIFQELALLEQNIYANVNKELALSVFLASARAQREAAER